MTRVLLIGQIPETVDFSDPAIPPGMDAEKVRAGLAVAAAKTIERGWGDDQCMVPPDAEAATRAVIEQLAKADYDCIVIGGGLRLPPRGLALFEAVLNAVHSHAPNAAIAFNTRPDDTAEAAARVLAD
jgi:hypothetical protein